MQFTHILDIQYFDARKCSLLKFVLSCSSLYLNCLCFYNYDVGIHVSDAAPRIFPLLWKICRPLMSDATRNKISVLGGMLDATGPYSRA